jgi:hypothetical protein
LKKRQIEEKLKAEREIKKKKILEWKRTKQMKRSKSKKQKEEIQRDMSKIPFQLIQRKPNVFEKKKGIAGQEK